jgi:hypothetical protein
MRLDDTHDTAPTEQPTEATAEVVPASDHGLQHAVAQQLAQQAKPGELALFIAKHVPSSQRATLFTFLQRHAGNTFAASVARALASAPSGSSSGRWADTSLGTSPTGAPVHQSASSLDHVEGKVGRGIIAAYDAERSVEGVFRGAAKRPDPPDWLAKAWAENTPSISYPMVREDRNAELGANAALSAGLQQMNWTPEQGDREVRAAAAFFAKYPSRASQTVTWFETIWNAFDTFQKYPLQAFMYASASPVTTPEASSVHTSTPATAPASRNSDPGPAQPSHAGSSGPAQSASPLTASQATSAEQLQPKNALWAAYARAVQEKLDPQLVDEAYFRAHMADMQGAFASERFKELYDLAPANYRVVVEAYAETIGRAETQLSNGRPIEDISRGLFVDGLRDLVKRKSVGMLWTEDGLKNIATLSASAELMLKQTAKFGEFVATSDRPASTKGVVDNVRAWFRDDAAFTRATATGTVTAEDIWSITQTLRGFSGQLDEKDLLRIQRFAEANKRHLTPGAMHTVQALLAQGPSRPLAEAAIAAAPAVDPHKVPIELSGEQIALLRREFHIAIPDGATELTDAMFADASFSEPDRREDRSTPVRRWPLHLSDLTGRQLRRGLSNTGLDGKLSFDEIVAGIRNAQALVRSKLIDDFNREYPIAPGGLLQYSANVLALNRTYGENEFYGMVPNAIMPVDNDGKPKNQLWRDFTTAYDQHKKTGTPSMDQLERLWIKAHMEDFRAIDGADFQAKADAFWEQAAKDPALESMAIYAKAMVSGRDVFEHARAEHLTEEAALAEAMKHFSSTIATSGSFPFWREDLDEISRYFKGGKNEPAVDDRGLPTDKTLALRAASGLKEMSGLAPLIGSGLKQKRAGVDQRTHPDQLVDITKALKPEQVANLDPTIIDFYRHPLSYDIQAFAQLAPLQAHLLQAVGAVAGQGHIPASVTRDGHDLSEDKQRRYAVEQDVWQDKHGRTHWDRDLVIDGKDRTLFHATFEMVGQQLCETFNVHGVAIPLYFNLVPSGNGLRLELDPAKSSKLAPKSIVFFTQPAGDGMLRTDGTYQGFASSAVGKVEFLIHRRDGEGGGSTQ